MIFERPKFGLQQLRHRFVCMTFVVLLIGLSLECLFAQSKPKLILDADTANEIDDMYAIVRMLKQEKFEVLALTSSQWMHYLAEEDSVGGSQRENEAMVNLLGARNLPTPIGSREPMGKPWGGDGPKDSPAAQFIITAAKAATPENKLLVVCLGASTNLASAIKMEPAIAQNIDAYVLGFRYDHEKKVWNKSSFNIRRDLNAADFLLNCEALNLHVMPANVARSLTFERDKTFTQHETMGKLGAHLTAKWKARFADFENWVMWDLALVEALIHPEMATMKQCETPPENKARQIWVYDSIQVQAMRDDYWKTVLSGEQKRNTTMTENENILLALKEGNFELLESVSCDEATLADESIQVALRRAAERVVSHRMNYRATIQKAVEIGVPCDIWTASRAGLLDLVRKHIADDSSLLDAEDDNGRTPLQRAALIYGVCQECEQVVDFLLEAGAKVDIFTGCTLGMSDVVQAEIKRDASLVNQRREGSTPLNWAVRPRRNNDAAPGICKALLEAGADVYDADAYESDMTPLHHAAEWGPKICLQLVDLLIEAGADINAKDGQGWTALQYAKDRGRKEMIEHLIKHGATQLH